MEIGRLASEMPSPDSARIRLGELQARVVNVSETARHMAYELHNSALDDLGLAISLETLCHEFSAGQDIMVKFKHGSLPPTIPSKVASNLYRITQESLQNIAKHAQAKRVAVQLAAQERELRLSIKDDGRGFDLTAVEGRGGLGLVGMKERARLLDAKFSIDSKPDLGTRITVTVHVGSSDMSS